MRSLQDRGALRSARVAEAFLSIPREQFLPELARARGLGSVYADEAIVTKRDGWGRPISSSSQPAMMAAMLERLNLARGQRVLEIGAGTGYNAALLSRLVGEEGAVVSLDVDPGLAARAGEALAQAGCRVSVLVGDARQELPPGPFDRIIVTANAAAIPRIWLLSLREGGLLEVPLQLPGLASQLIAVLRRQDQRLGMIDWTWGGFMPLHGGDGGWAAPDPSLSAGGSREPLVLLQGEAVEELSDEAAGALLARLLTEEGLVLEHGDFAGGLQEAELLELYLGLAIPAPRRVRLVRSGSSHLGILHPRDWSLAAVELPPRRAGARYGWSLRSWGESPTCTSAACALRMLLRRWLNFSLERRVHPGLIAFDDGSELLTLAAEGWGEPGPAG